MATIAVNDDYVAVSCEHRVLALSRNEPKLQVLDLSSSLKRETKKENMEKESLDSRPANNAYILGVTLSRCNTWLAVWSSNKKLSLWKAHCCMHISDRCLARAADKVKFSPNGDNIIVADKSGDAYLFSVNNPHEEGVLLLGHLSMLLDVLLSDDERYIITCDRDEKIRVSHFPNAYNVQSYCLGHTEFVSCLSFLPHNKTILVSGSGDGSIKFWNYVPGTLMHEIKCHQHVELNNSNFCKHVSTALVKHSLDYEMCFEDNFGANSETPAVMNVSGCIVGASSVLGVSLAHFKGCLIYKVNGASDNISSSVTQIIHFQNEPWDVHLSQENVLWYLSCNDKEPVRAIYLDMYGEIVRNCEHSDTIEKILSLINSHCEWFTHIAMSERMCVMYKRKFDNIHEYLERKKVKLSL